MLSGGNGCFELHNALKEAIDKPQIVIMQNIDQKHYFDTKIM